MKSSILTVGLNHRTAPVHIRKRVPAALCLRHEVTETFLSTRDPSLCPEICVLSTCNRTVIYAISSDQKRGQESLRHALAGHESFLAGSGDFLYSYADHEAAAHLFAGAGATSIAYAAVTCAREQLGRLAGLTALVTGAGKAVNRAARTMAIEQVRAIVDAEADAFWQWCSAAA